MFLRFFSVLSVSLLCFACAEYKLSELDEAGTEKKTNKEAFQKKIINGSLDTGHSSVVAVMGDTSSCTGTIISPTVVLTAAHCVIDRGVVQSPREVWVTNSFDRRPMEAAAITRYTVHPGWSTQEIPSNDVALLLLDRPLQTAAMPIHFGETGSLVGQTIQAVGFGVTNGWTQSGGGEKRATTLVISDTFSGGFDASSPGGRQTDTCQGDSGGPAIVTLNGIEHILGVVSSGPEGCTGLTHYAGMFDKMTWVAQTMGGQNGASTPPVASASSQSSAQGQRAACPYVNDGECDEPTYCDYGTDTADCTQSASNPSTQQNQQAQPSASANSMGGSDTCRYAFDGMCDEPMFCEVGTDTSDCAAMTTQTPQSQNGYTSQATPPVSSAGGGDSCQWANDNVCDEPTYCAFGTDTADCQAAQTSPATMGTPSQGGFSDSCLYALDGLCDEPMYCDFGTDQTDCAHQVAPSQSPSSNSNSNSNSGRPPESSCVWANDGVCDEPTYCAPGTDGGDCN